MNEDKLYEDFVERYFETGTREMPEAWPQELRVRCKYFLRMVESRVGDESDSAAPSPEPPSSRPTSEAFAPRDRRSESERYVVEREIARGGMGRILLAYDREFRRHIAVKIALHPPGDQNRTTRFVEEAQATAQLEHPNIAPVYDLGVEANGKPYFTMKWIRGRDLKQIIASAGGEYTLTRLVQVIQQAAMGVHFANTRGVIHRDLKPQNVMVGDFGEVLVVDWGLAKVLSLKNAGEASGASVSTERREEGQSTLDGTVQGSLAYMAPEQARGEIAAVDARTDVYGLGTILYEVLTGVPPRPESSFQALLGKARRGDIVSPRDRAPARAIPAQLEAICLKSLSPEKSSRFESAKAFHDALQAYIEGIHDAERRAVEAARLRGIADAHLGGLREAELAAAKAREAESALRLALKPHEAEARKQELWELSARSKEAQAQASTAFNQTTTAYTAVLSIDGADRAARAALADIYLERLKAAEARGDAEAAALYEGLVAQHDDGRYDVELVGEGELRLETLPPGASVKISRYSERGPFLVESEIEAIGVTPIRRRLPRGSYLLRISHPGFEEARLPVLIDRSGSCAARIRLVAENSIPPGFLQVAGGLTIVGGDTELFPSLPRERIAVGEVFVAELPVTLNEYCAFLNSEFAGAAQPWSEQAPSFNREEYVIRDSSGHFAPISRLDPRLPVFGITLASIRLYCGWLGRKLGRKIRLLTEPEWERCARGADGRVFPWGNGFDWALMKGGLSRPGEPTPEPVGSFPRDVSPFGIRDLAGGVREHCEGMYGEGYRMTKGGSWFNPVPFIFRADCRTSIRDANRATDVGFRVCYDGALEF